MMIDPHVERLYYTIRLSGFVDYDKAKPIYYETGDFIIQHGDSLWIQMKRTA